MRKLRGPKGNMDKCRDRTAKSLGKSHRRYAEAVLLNSLHKTPHVFRQYYTPAHLLPPRLPQNYRGIFVKKNRNYNTHPFSYHFPLTTSPSLSLSLPLMRITLLLLILRWIFLFFFFRNPKIDSEANSDSRWRWSRRRSIFLCRRGGKWRSASRLRFLWLLRTGFSRTGMGR